jgi:hypothetical protein
MHDIGPQKRKPRTRKRRRRPGKKKTDIDRRVYESFSVGFQVGILVAILVSFDTCPQLLHRQNSQGNVKKTDQAPIRQNSACGKRWG